MAGGPGGGQKRPRSAWELGPPPGTRATVCPAGVMGSFCPPAGYYQYTGDENPRKQAVSYSGALRMAAPEPFSSAMGPPPPPPPPSGSVRLRPAAPVAVPGQPLSGQGARSTIQPFNGLVKEESSLSVEDVNERVRRSASPPCTPPGQAGGYLAAALMPLPPS